jgi:hypothetical protein
MAGEQREREAAAALERRRAQQHVVASLAGVRDLVAAAQQPLAVLLLDDTQRHADGCARARACQAGRAGPRGATQPPAMRLHACRATSAARSLPGQHASAMKARTLPGRK